MSDLTIFDIPRLLGYQFFQYALMGGIIVAVSCALVGLFLILRKEAMIGDGVAHTAFGGIAIGLYLGIYPILTALIVSVFAVISISYMRRKGLAHSDSAIAVILALGFSTGLIIISLAGGFNVELFGYLFGSILTIDSGDLMVGIALGIITLAFIGLFYKELLSITFDEESSRLMGIPVSFLETSFSILVAVTIVLSIKVIGIILVVALLVLPGLSALQLRMSFKGTTVASIFFGVISVVVGLLLSAIYDVATSGIIIFTAVGIFLFVAAYRKLE
jgi:zinc transport system permease protein